jgi:uncharacterized membrane protein YhaH (DUF805 family)
MNSYLGPIRKYGTIAGRASRKEYWMFFLWNIIIAIVLGFIAGATGMAKPGESNWLVTIYQLFILIPSITCGVRRMHDGGHSGWWLLFPLVNLFFAVQDSQPGDNKYGPNPKSASPAMATA